MDHLRKSTSGVAMPLVVILVVVVMIAAAGIISVSFQQQNLTPASTPVSSTPQSSATSSIVGSLQDYLKDNCKPFDTKNYTAQVLTEDELPVKIDTDVLFLKPHTFGYLASCSTNIPGMEGQAFLSIGSEPELLVYDDDSVELGHGGPPFLGSFGTPVIEDETTKITIYISGPHGGPSLITDLPIEMRGQKTFTTSTGDKFYVNISRQAIKAGDPRLVTLLEKYSGPVDSEVFGDDYKDAKTLKGNMNDQIMADIVQTFFANQNATTPEIATLKRLQTELGAINLK